MSIRYIIYKKTQAETCVHNLTLDCSLGTALLEYRILSINSIQFKKDLTSALKRGNIYLYLILT